MHCQMTCKGTLRQVFYLSEAPPPSYDPILSPPPLYTVYVYTCTVYLIHTVKGGGGRANR
jgi:hypothetical protein